MAKSGGGFRGLVGGGRVRVGNLRIGDSVLRRGDIVRRGGGFRINKRNRVTFGVSTGGASGKIARSDLVGGFVLRGNRWTRIGS